MNLIFCKFDRRSRIKPKNQTTNTNRKKTNLLTSVETPQKKNERATYLLLKQKNYRWDFERKIGINGKDGNLRGAPRRKKINF